MRLFWLAIFLVLIFVFIHFQIVWLAVLLGLVIILDLISAVGRKSATAARVFGRGVKEDLKREYKDIEDAKAIYPSEELFVSLFSGAGKRAGEEIIPERDEIKHKSKEVDKSFKSMGNGATEFIKQSKKLFKK